MNEAGFCGPEDAEARVGFEPAQSGGREGSVLLFGFSEHYVLSV